MLGEEYTLEYLPLFDEELAAVFATSRVCAKRLAIETIKDKCIWCGSMSTGAGCHHSPTGKHVK